MEAPLAVLVFLTQQREGSDDLSEEEGGGAHSADSASEDEGREGDRSASSSDSEALRDGNMETKEDDERWACGQKLSSLIVLLHCM